MFHNITETIQELQVLSIISMLLFFVAFIMVLYHVIKLDKKFTDYMGNLPIEDIND